LEFFLQFCIVRNNVLAAQGTSFLHIEQFLTSITNCFLKGIQVKRERMNSFPLRNLEHGQHLANIEGIAQIAELFKNFTHNCRFFNILFLKSIKPERRNDMTLTLQLSNIVEISVCFPHFKEWLESLVLNLLDLFCTRHRGARKLLFDMIGHILVPLFQSFYQVFAPGHVVV
jgi:hypothetical protein